MSVEVMQDVPVVKEEHFVVSNSSDLAQPRKVGLGLVAVIEVEYVFVCLRCELLTVCAPRVICHVSTHLLSGGCRPI